MKVCSQVFFSLPFISATHIHFQTLLRCVKKFCFFSSTRHWEIQKKSVPEVLRMLTVTQKNVPPVFARKVELGTTCILAELCKDQRKYNEAKGLFIKALKIALETGHEEGTAECYDNLGSIFKSLGEYVEAKEHYEKALAIAEKIGDRETEAKCNGNLGSIFHSLGEYVNAQEYYEKALAIAGKIGHRERESQGTRILFLYNASMCVSAPR